MKTYVFYELSSGKVVCSGLSRALPVNDNFNTEPGIGLLDVPNGRVDNVYVDVKSLQTVQKKAFSVITTNTPLTANGTDEAIISGIPAGVQAQWPDGQIDIVNDGEIGFSVDLPGTYTFRFTAVPYLDQEVVIEAIPAT